MRVFHFSDTHLGHQQYAKTDATGLNQREVDLYAAFHRVVDAAVAEKADLVIHAGDLFDGVRPSNRALHHAIDGFLKLSRAGIPVVVIAGNHEHPKLRETGSPLRLLEHLDGVHVAYQGKRETLDIACRDGPVRVHAVPQCADNASLEREIANASSSGRGRDLLVVHGAVHSLKAFSHAEFNELSLNPAWFDGRFDYVALGHYHGVTEVAPKAWYCGAPERVSIAESGQAKGFLEVGLDGAGPVVTHREIAGRPYLDLARLQADGLTATQVKDLATAAAQAAPEGAVCRLRIEGLDPTLRGALDVRAIDRAGAHLLHFDHPMTWADAGQDTRGAERLGGLAEELEAFVASQPMAGADRAAVLARARRLLEEAAP